MKRKLLLLISLLSFAALAFAQERTVTGTVKDADGAPLPGATVLIKGTTKGTVADLDGKFSIAIDNANTTLVVKIVGYKEQEIQVGTKAIINVALDEDTQQLDEIVVTALNITREKASLGYATQSLGDEAVTRAKENNFINSLSGKVAGVQIRTNNNFGGSTNMLIRGTSSLTGNNQPLFVVNGVPIDNRTGNTTAQQSGQPGYDYGNAASDINPEDIENISILKGAAATALYGSRAANGAVIITTKQGAGKRGIGISLSTGVTWGRIQKSTFAEYQNQYGAGYGPYYGDNDPYLIDFEDVNGDGVNDLVVPTTEDGSYGGQFSNYEGTDVYQWDSFVPTSENFGKAYPYRAARNTPADFFEQSVTYNNSVSVYGGDDKNSFRLSYTNYQATGILPNSEMNKHNINFSGSSQFHKRLKADVNVNVNSNNTTGRNSTGYNDNLMSQYRQWWQVNVDVKDQERAYKESGRNYTWNAADFRDPETPIYWDNPYWTRFENYQTDTRERIFGNIGLNYTATDWLSFLGRITLDRYNELREERRQVGSVPTDFGVARNDESSGYQRYDRFVNEYNFDLMATVNKYFSEDFAFYGLLGMNIRKQNFESVLASTNGGLAVPGLYSLSNSKLTPLLPIENKTEKQVNGYFANLNFGWRNMVYLDLTGRIDVSSALPVGNNSYPYGSVALSYIFSESLKKDWLNLGKLRVNYASVGNDTDANRTYDFYERNDNFGSAVIYTLPNRKNNPRLEPEKTNSIEAGLELSMFSNRLGVDFAYYKTNSFNQIFPTAVSRATGYSSKVINGGEIENNGVELALRGVPVQSNDFRWDIILNWSRNRNKVISLIDGVDNLVINSYQGGVSVNAQVGKPYGILKGTGYEYNENGERVIDANGFYKSVADQIIGDPNPEYNMGITNSFNYKGFVFSFLIDIQKGGDIYSLDMHYGQGTGLYPETAALNELGNPVRDAVGDGGGVLNEGAKEDGSPNDVRARADYYAGAFYWGNATRNPGIMTVYDASYVKLREASLSYRLTRQQLGSWSQGITISVVGRNLWIIHKNLPYADPETGITAGNAQGYISGAYPTTRTIGFKLDFDF